MLNLFNRNKPLLDEDVIEWIFDCYAWAFEQFDKDVFFNESMLVIPDNKHFPGKETTAHGMANLIFDQVKNYAGMAHWPTRLVDLAETNGQMPQQGPIKISGALRGKNAQTQFTPPPVFLNSAYQSSLPQSAYPQSATPAAGESANALTINPIGFTYHQQQLKSPEGIIAHFAHSLSYHLACTATTPPPGGKDYLPMAGELTGIFMGFGIMFANSAHVRKSQSCGSCGLSGPVRQVFLSDEEATYALALFCQLKGIEMSQARKYLKKHLRGFFKAALKDCQLRLTRDFRLKLA